MCNCSCYFSTSPSRLSVCVYVDSILELRSSGATHTEKLISFQVKELHKSFKKLSSFNFKCLVRVQMNQSVRVVIML